MIYVNVGAYSDNKRVVTKSALKRLVNETPELVRFDQISALGSNGLPKLIALSDISASHTLSVVGPDPYSERKWYASIQLKNGKATVS
jgi:hypothetical protein